MWLPPYDSISCTRPLGSERHESKEEVTDVIILSYGEAVPPVALSEIESPIVDCLGFHTYFDECGSGVVVL